MRLQISRKSVENLLFEALSGGDPKKARYFCRCAALCSDYGSLFERLVPILATPWCKLPPPEPVLFVPVRPMLQMPATGSDPLFAKVLSRRMFVEQKLDGVRI